MAEITTSSAITIDIAAAAPTVCHGTLAMAATMITDPRRQRRHRRPPPIVHATIAYGAIVCNLAAARIEIAALTASSRIVDEVNRQIQS
jgi:hypothetical protein